MFGHETANDRVTCLVIGRVELLRFAHNHGAAFGAHHDLVFRLLEFIHADDALVRACGKQRRLVDQVRKVGTRKPGRATCDHAWANVVTKGHLAHMHFENHFPATYIRQRYDDLPIETTGSQQRRIENVRTVSRRNDDDAFSTFKAVHFDKHLVQRLLAFIMTATKARTTVPADRIEFVDEDDARSLFLGLVEHVANSGCANTDKHLDKVRA